jgi:hypothetical protein
VRVIAGPPCPALATGQIGSDAPHQAFALHPQRFDEEFGTLQGRLLTVFLQDLDRAQASQIILQDMKDRKQKTRITTPV